jgi:hypothetical protein
MLMKMIILIVGLLAAPSFAFGYCSEPNSPYSNPSAPYCSDNVCDSWEADSYKDEIESQMRKWNEYAQEAIDYAKCKNKKLISEWSDFVSFNKVRR